MHRILLFTLCAVALGLSVNVAAAAGGSAREATDQDRIQGSWKCVTTFREGRQVQEFVGVIAVFEGNRLTWKKLPQTGRETIRATFRLDPSKSPAHMDWTPDGTDQVHQRLYLLKGDTLWMATNFGRNPRPESFDSAKWQFTMKRIVPSRPPR